MPSFTSLLPGSARIKSPSKGATLKAPTATTQIEKRTRPIDEGNSAKYQARIDALVHRQRHGEPDGSPWNGIPLGMHMVVGIDGYVLTSNRL
jgi:hypothetical protein